MTVAAAPKSSERAPQPWALSVKAYHALGELGLVIHGPGGRLTSSSVPAFTVDLSALFAR